MEIARLPLRVRAASFEPPWGLLNRLTVRHRLHDVNDLLATTNMPRHFLANSLAAGQRIEVLSAMSGFLEIHLRASALRRSSMGLLLGETRVASGRRSGVVRRGAFCPSCLREDMDLRGGPDACRTHRRWWWDIAAGIACAKHHVLLVTACAACGDAVSRAWLSPGVCPCGHDATSTPAAPTTSCGMAFEDYFEGRLRGAVGGGGELLDAMTPYDASLAVSHVGRARLHGREPPPFVDLAPVQHLEVRAAGFDALSDWPAGFHRVLDRIAPPRMAAKIGPAAMYRVIHHWLSQKDGEPFEPMRREIGVHYLSMWPATQKMTIFGIPVVQSDQVTLGVLASWAGCSIERALDVATRDGCLTHAPPSRPSRATPISRGDAKRLAKLIRGSVATAEAHSILGLKPDSFKSLLRAALIKPLTTGGAGGSRFKRAELERLLSRLTRGVAPVGVAPADALSVTAAAGTTNRALSAILEAILDGRIVPVARLLGSPGMAGILITPKQAYTLPYARSRG